MLVQLLEDTNHCVSSQRVWICGINMMPVGSNLLHSREFMVVRDNSDTPEEL